MASAKASVVFTGKLVSGIRRQAEEAAQAAGFIVHKSVKASTTYLVVGDLVVLPPNCFRKNKEAARRGTKVLTEREWEAVLAATVAAGAGAASTAAAGSAAGCRKRCAHEAQGGKVVAERGQKGKAGSQAGTAARKERARSKAASGGGRDGKHVEVMLDVCDNGSKEEEEAGPVKRQRTRPATRGAAAASASEGGGGGKGGARARKVIK